MHPSVVWKLSGRCDTTGSLSYEVSNEEQKNYKCANLKGGGHRKEWKFGSFGKIQKVLNTKRINLFMSPILKILKNCDFICEKRWKKPSNETN
jgi:hypothetical protein